MVKYLNGNLNGGFSGDRIVHSDLHKYNCSPKLSWIIHQYNKTKHSFSRIQIKSKSCKCCLKKAKMYRCERRYPPKNVIGFVENPDFCSGDKKPLDFVGKMILHLGLRKFIFTQ